jgi:hypothetical protein
VLALPCDSALPSLAKLSKLSRSKMWRRDNELWLITHHLLFAII